MKVNNIGMEQSKIIDTTEMYQLYNKGFRVYYIHFQVSSRKVSLAGELLRKLLSKAVRPA